MIRFFIMTDHSADTVKHVRRLDVQENRKNREE